MKENIFQFTDEERAYLTEMRAIIIDTQGKEVLVGLSLEETAIYIEYGRNKINGQYDLANGDIYLELHDKHEKIRMAVINAEVDLRNENPTKH